MSLSDFLVFDEDLTLTFHNRTHCHFMIGLGFLGLARGEAAAKAEEQFGAVLALRSDHLGAMIHQRMNRQC